MVDQIHEDMTFTPRGREVIRVRPDGTSWVAPDITDKEREEVLPILIEFAAQRNKKALDCENNHEK